MSNTVDPTIPWIGRVRSRLERWWDRLDRSVLRLQGRVDTPTYDRWLPYGFAVLHGALLTVLVLARFHSLDLGTETAQVRASRVANRRRSSP